MRAEPLQERRKRLAKLLSRSNKARPDITQKAAIVLARSRRKKNSDRGRSAHSKALEGFGAGRA